MGRQRGPNEDTRFSLVPRDTLGVDFYAFLTDCRARCLSPRTIALYQQKWENMHAIFLGWGITRVQDISAQHIRDLLTELGRTHNRGGVRCHYRVLKTFLRWCVGEGIIQDNPIARIQTPKVPENPLPPVSLETVKAMLATCDKSLTGQRDRALLLFLLDTGVRASELCAMDIMDVILETGQVVIREGKGGKRRIVRIGAKAMRELLRYLRLRGSPLDGPLFTTDDDRRLTYVGLVQILRRRAKKAGVPTPWPHAFRRAFALLCLRNGMDIYSLQKLMGHADLTTLRRYLAQTERDLLEAHERHGPVDRWL